MRLTLINSPLQNYEKIRKERYYTTPPIGLGSLATVAKDLGCEVNLIDAEALGISPQKIASMISDQRPDVIGINLTSPTFNICKEIVGRISAPKIIAGGAHATIRPEQTLREIPTLDMVAVGEAEKTIEELVNREFNPESVKGVYYRRGNEIIQNPKRKLLDNLDSLPPIDRTFFINDPYQENGHFKSVIMGSRGCPNLCSFCASPLVAGNKIRARSIGDILDEMEGLKESLGINSVHFLDNYFIYNKTRSLEFIEELEKRKLGLEWRALARVDLIANAGQDFVKSLKKGGCYKLVFGVESGSQRVLDSIHKRTTPEQARQAIEYCKRTGIKTKAYYMFGFPTETVGEMEQTLELARQLDTDVACFLQVKAYPGTEMYNSLVETYGETALQSYIDLQSQIPLDHLPSKTNFGKYHLGTNTPFSNASPEQIKGMLRKAYNLYYTNGDKRK